MSETKQGNSTVGYNLLITYKRLRNKTDSLIKKAKKDFIKNKIKENKGCLKKLWKTLKNLGFQPR